MKLKLCLSGGMKSGWQEKVIEELGDWFEIYDPRSVQDKDEKEFVHWDLQHIRQASVVLAYMEKHNKSGYGLSVETGYACAGKVPVILVEEHPDNGRRDMFVMHRHMAARNYKTLDEAIAFLKDSAKRALSAIIEVNG